MRTPGWPTKIHHYCSTVFSPLSKHFSILLQSSLCISPAEGSTLTHNQISLQFHLLSKTAPVITSQYAFLMDQLLVTDFFIAIEPFQGHFKNDFFFFVWNYMPLMSTDSDVYELCLNTTMHPEYLIFLTVLSSCFISDRVPPDDASSRFKLQPNPVYYIKQSRDPSSLSWVHQTDNADRDQCTPLKYTIYPRCVLLGDEGR